MDELKLEWICRLYNKPKYLSTLNALITDMYIEDYGKKSYVKAKQSIDAMTYSIARAKRYGLDGCKYTNRSSNYKENIIIDGANKKTGVGLVGVVNIVNSLERRGYVTRVKGGIIGFDIKESNYFIINKPLLEVIPDMVYTKNKSRHLPLKTSSVEVVKVENETKVLCNFRKNEEIRNMMGIVDKYNDFIQKFDVSVDGEKPLIQVIRKFSRGSFDYGGRFYYIGSGNPQSIKSEMRQLILIDGEPTVELDYKAMHPALLAEMNNIIWGDGFDPYHGLSELGVTIDEKQLEGYRVMYNPRYNPIRNLSKIALLYAINCRSMKQACAILEKTFVEDSIKSVEFRKFFGIECVDTEMVFEDLRVANNNIAKYFFSDVGIKLQRTDSNIAEKVLTKCIDAEVPVICVHDSFIVKRQHHGFLNNVMKLSWLEEMGTNYNCVVEEK